MPAPEKSRYDPSMRKLLSSWFMVMMMLAALAAVGVMLSGQTLNSAAARTGPQASIPAPSSGSTAEGVQVLYVGFTPPTGVAPNIVHAIDQAEQEVLVQAYGFTHNAIAQALVRAHRRGVTVQVLLDQKSDSTNRYVMGLFQEAGVSVRLDGAHAIAHNKVMVIDARVLVTGSFNFTNSAETRNAENVLILRGDSLAKTYRDNWQQHWAHARP
jgi:phosphatidylserine/phosphatidylglycerophosphate/cardiolipin synthase-like enzyme